MRLLILLPVLVCLQASAQQQQLYYASGLLQYSYEVKDGKFNGSFTSYHDNGLMKAKGNFINGKRSGTWQAWDEEGVLRIKRSYNNDATIDLLAEWKKTGCQVDAAYLEQKERRLNEALASVKYEDLFFHLRYWNLVLPSKENADIFAADFTEYVKKGIADGRITAFSDDRCVNIIKPAEAKWLTGTPDAFLLKEDHSFSQSTQRNVVNIISLGLTFHYYGDTKTAWLYFPHLRSSAQGSTVASAIVTRLDQGSFTSTIDMTTFHSNNKPRKISGTETIYLRLAEIDMETTAWIYLQEKDLAGR